MTRLDGKTAIGIEIIRAAQANTIDISNGVRAAVDELRKSLPEGVEIAITSDDATFIRESVKEVITSLLLANAIVILIIFAFLRSFRAVIAPAISIPVSLIGTLAAIWAAGFSINILTLLALVVATGLVVDDAIVVIENIARHRAMGAGPRAAAVLGTRRSCLPSWRRRRRWLPFSFRSRSCPASSVTCSRNSDSCWRSP